MTTYILPHGIVIDVEGGAGSLRCGDEHVHRGDGRADLCDAYLSGIESALLAAACAGAHLDVVGVAEGVGACLDGAADAVAQGRYEDEFDAAEAGARTVVDALSVIEAVGLDANEVIATVDEALANNL